MSAVDFLYADPDLFFVEMDAYNGRAVAQDFENFSLGEYILLAVRQGLADAFSKRKVHIYPSKPFLCNVEKETEDVDDKIIDMITRHNARKGKDIYGNKK